MNNILDIIELHIIRHQNCELIDIYKLLFQAAMGPQHYLLNNIHKDYLLTQWNSADYIDDVLLEPIAPDGSVCRAHFAPLKNSGVLFEDVFRAFVDTAAVFCAEESKLARWWGDIQDYIALDKLPFTKLQYDRLNEGFNTGGFSAVSHSAIFNSTYRPKYVIILKEFLTINYE
jgi:hypothetical protein